MNEYHWWSCYANFAPGKDVLPVFWQVIGYYRELRGMSKKDLAEALHYTVRFIEMLENEKNIDMPKDRGKRATLATLLKIPPALLGISIGGDGILEEHDKSGLLSVMDGRTITFYEDMLASCWELYHTSSLTRATQNIGMWLKQLEREAKRARGVRRDQVKALLCRFYQLAALAARDRLDIARALQYEQEAIRLAFDLENAELLATSLFRRSCLYLQTRQYQLALQDAEGALPYANRSRDPLKAEVYLVIGECLAHFVGGERKLQTKALRFFDTAGTIIRKGNLESDGSFVSIDISGLYTERAKALLLWRQHVDAADALAIAHKQLSPQRMRQQVTILVAEAKLYNAQGYYDDGADSALHALRIVQAVKMGSKEQQIRALLPQYVKHVPSYDATRQLVQRLEMG